jgi:hypothetical protein
VLATRIETGSSEGAADTVPAAAVSGSIPSETSHVETESAPEQGGEPSVPGESDSITS